MVLLLLTGPGNGRLVGALVLTVLTGIWLGAYISLHYTRYVITSLRIIRVSGVLGRRVAWIPWLRVTEVSFSQTPLQRLVKLATIRIDSANDLDQLKELSNIRHPLRFHRRLAEVVSAFQKHSDLGLDGI